ncbi:LamG-like jellyroll fold domain-containing protein [Planctomycetota bacterium]
MNMKAISVVTISFLAIACVAVHAQPLMHFTFNDGTTSDWSGNGVVGTLLGEAAIVDDAERGKVVQINARGMQAVGPFPMTTEYTIAAWFKLDVPRAGRVFIGGGSFQFRTDNQGGNLHHWVEYRHPNFLTKFDTRAEDNPDGQLDGNWHHYVWRLTEKGVFAMYVDGEMAPRRDDIGFEDSDEGNLRPKDFGGTIEELIFGANSEDGSGGGGGHQGYIDNIRVYN